MANAAHSPANQLYDENEQLRNENKGLDMINKHLRIDIAELEHRNKTARANGYEEGYQTARRDARQGR